MHKAKKRFAFSLGAIIVGAALLFLLMGAGNVFAAETSNCNTCTSIASCLKCLNYKLVFGAAPETPPVVTPTPAPSPNPTPQDYPSQVAQYTHILINAERASLHLSPLEWNDSLATAAKLHSIDMAAKNYFSHDGVGGTNFSTRIQAQGMVCSAMAENIAQAYYTTDPWDAAHQVVNLWMNSPGHRTNIVGNYSIEGIGVSIGSDGKLYATQDFCN